MRTVIFHLKDTTSQEVGQRLDEFARLNIMGEWRYPREAVGADWVLNIRFYDELLNEVEEDLADDLESALGQMPDVSVSAEVSGRFSGEKEIQQLATYLLSQFQGVAWDDYTEHCWTLAEIQQQVLVEGRTFFAPED